MKEMNERELYWLAGLFEGEGTFSSSWGKGARRRSIHWRIGMTDEEVILALPRITGMGILYRVEHTNPKWQDQLWWIVYQKEECEELERVLLPLLSPRRQQKLRELKEERR